jgi:hypothetical protein
LVAFLMTEGPCPSIHELPRRGIFSETASFRCMGFSETSADMRIYADMRI